MTSEPVLLTVDPKPGTSDSSLQTNPSLSPPEIEVAPVPPQKILLVKPHARLETVLGLEAFMRLEPLEFGYLAAAAPDHDYQVLDLRCHRFPIRKFLKTLRQFQPDLVGFTGYSHESTAVKLLAEHVRRVLPSAKTIVGGHHATSVAYDFALPIFDGIVRGEGCGPFKEIVRRTAQEKDFRGIPNVVVPGPDFDREAIKGWPTPTNPAKMPEPRRDLWPVNDYYCIWPAEKLPVFESVYPPVTMMRTSWGCYMKCSFCVVPHLSGGKHVPREVMAVCDELERIETDHVYFCDDENFINAKYAMALAEEIERRGIKKRYFAWTRSTTVNRSPELMRKWHEIGLDGVFIGFEFIDDKELKAHSKAATVNANEQALHTLREMDIVVHAAFILRSDYDEEDFARMRAYVDKMPASQCSFTVFTPIPGTEEYPEYEKDFTIPPELSYDLHDCMHPLLPMKLSRKRFSELYARQVVEGVRKTPLRVNHHLAPPRDMLRVFLADRRYGKGYKRIHKDFPKDYRDA